MDTDAIIDVLMRTDPFEMLPSAVLAELGPGVRVLTFLPDTYIFRQGEASLDCLLVVVEGMVEITVTNDLGEESVVGLRRLYDFFGETVVLSRQRYPGSARAKDRVTCLAVGQQDLERIIYGHPEFSGFFNTLLAERMRLLYEQVVADQAAEVCTGADAPLFRKRVSQVMTTPVVTCGESDTAAGAARIMAAGDIGAVVVTDARGRPRGIVTEKGLVRTLIADGRYSVADCPVTRVMYSEPLEIAPESFLGQALATMIRSRCRHLLVTERTMPVGMVTLGDLMRARSTATVLLARDIDGQRSLTGLAEIGRRADAMLETLMAEGVPVADVLEVMGRLHDRVTRQTIRLCEEKLQRQGYGTPPVDYCWINMGSAARREQTLRTDQDNAIITADPTPEQAEAVAHYFAHLADEAVEALAQCGFEKCTGNVMASNPRWRRSLTRWCAALDKWVGSSDPEDVRTLTILLDFRPIWGNRALAERFRQKVFAAFGDSIGSGHVLARDDRSGNIPIGFLGSIITEKSGPHKDQLNLKTGGMVHMVNAARILAVDSAISEPSTLGRLEALAKQGVLDAEDAGLFKTSFETLMLFKIQENLRQKGAGGLPDNHITPSRLDKRQRMLLRDALSGVARFQKLIVQRFSPFWLNFFG
ncbi:MAG: CBS domain-containing protein [Desulfobacterales bacterium]|nr:CBS domain-containing protein [Desulfobacterales bacterium]